MTLSFAFQKVLQSFAFFQFIRGAFLWLFYMLERLFFGKESSILFSDNFSQIFRDFFLSLFRLFFYPLIISCSLRVISTSTKMRHWWRLLFFCWLSICYLLFVTYKTTYSVFSDLFLTTYSVFQDLFLPTYSIFSKLVRHCLTFLEITGSMVDFVRFLRKTIQNLSIYRNIQYLCRWKITRKPLNPVYSTKDESAKGIQIENAARCVLCLGGRGL